MVAERGVSILRVFLDWKPAKAVAAWILLNAAFVNINMEFVYRKLTHVEGFSVNKTVCCFYPSTDSLSPGASLAVSKLTGLSIYLICFKVDSYHLD